MNKGNVTLVGAGCGRGLITVYGLEKVKNADVLVYDDLIDKELLGFAKSGCELIYVGKRLANHSETQQNINQILVEKALQGKNVVRLKGGDSFVFGRGTQELMKLSEEEIPFEVIPGVSSCIAVPESMGIAVTQRELAQSFTVVTGHTASEKEENYEALAKLRGTLVFLMGLSRIEEISRKLIENGKDKNTPCSVLSSGFSPSAKRIDGTLENIAEKSKAAVSPAVIVVGETCLYDFSKTAYGPLTGLCIAVTGTKSFTDKLSADLSKLGAFVQKYETLETVPLKVDLKGELSACDTLVFTSANGVDVFFGEMKNSGIDLRILGTKKFACIGEGSAKRLLSYGFHCDFIPTVYTAKQLGKQLAQNVSENERLLILRAAEGSKELTDELSEKCVQFKDLHIYKTKAKKPLCDFSENNDYIVFASAGGVKAFFENAGVLKNATAVCIGEITASALRQYTAVPFLVAKAHTAKGIIEAILEAE